MRKLEGLVKELVDDMEYLKRREERFAGTNGAYAGAGSHLSQSTNLTLGCVVLSSINQPARAEFCMVLHLLHDRPRRVADPPSALVLQAQVPDRLRRRIFTTLHMECARLFMTVPALLT
jgi:hypothetical protein